MTPYIRKGRKHPINRAPLKLDDLILLNFHKNGEGGARLTFFFPPNSIW